MGNMQIAIKGAMEPTRMQRMEIEYQEQTGLRDRDWYTIFYSQVCRTDLLVLGTNPGGSPHNPRSIVRASHRYYENGEHEYVDSCYPIQAVMKPFLKNVLGINDAELRSVTKSNLIFRRAPNEDLIAKIHGLSKGNAYREAVSTIEQMMEHVQPRLILLEGMKDNTFKQLYATGDAVPLMDPVKTHYRGSLVRILDAALMQIACLDRQVPVVSLGHPSHFGRLPVWGSKVVPTVRQLIHEFDIGISQAN
jgi:hypothetical protein